LYQFGFVGYWFWGNLLGERNRIPTLSNTLLTPIGKYMEKGFFHDGRWSELNATPMDGVASILVLLGVAAGVLCVFYLFLKWQQARQ
ncbi:MAG TPA: hypothetical protein VKX46_09315, partial [Ktedonobacteraceae bacterium]|nr:hypothetical protein [Ktedonobacteraceae bacterium]